MNVSLDAIVRGRQEQAPRILLYSPPKIGKTGFAAQVPGIVFIAAEQGTQEYNVARIPTIQKCSGRGYGHQCGWSVFKAWLNVLLNEKHDFKAVAIDTLDWLEGVLFSHLIATDSKGKHTMAEAHGGYGKAYDVAVDEWRSIANTLDSITIKRNMMVLILAHASVQKFYDPSSESYDQYRLKMHKGGSGFWTEWADAILFANHETVQNLDTGNWTATGRRVIYTSPPLNFAFIAGNRYGLPPQLDLDYQSFLSAMESSTPAALKTELEAVLAKLPEEVTYRGEKRTKDDIRRGFDNALDRRTMRLVIETARSLK